MNSLAAVTARRSCRRYGRRISIFQFLYILCVVLELHNIFDILATRSAFFVHGVILGSFMFIHTWYSLGKSRRLLFSFPACCHSNYRSIFSSLSYQFAYFLWTALGLICAHSFHVIFRLGSLGTNQISTAPPAVPDLATKYTEATGGLRSVTPFEAPRRNPLVWGTADDSSGYSLPPPPFFFGGGCVCVTLVARFSVLCCGGFYLSAPSVLLYVLLYLL